MTEEEQCSLLTLQTKMKIMKSNRNLLMLKLINTTFLLGTTKLPSLNPFNDRLVISMRLTH